MRTIAEKLSYLNNTKGLLKDRLNSLGAEITSSTTFRNYLTWLDTFYGEVSDKTDLSQNGVVGRTSQKTTTGTQLIGFNNKSQTTINGIKYSIENNVITLDGTATDNVRYILTDLWSLKEQGNYSLKIEEISGSWTAGIVGLSLRDNNNAQKTYHQVAYNTSDLKTTKEYSQDVVSNTTKIGLYINSGSVFSNYKFRIIYNYGSTSSSYEDFTGGEASPSQNFPQAINNLTGNVNYKISGKNKLVSGSSYNKKDIGITGSYNENDGSFSITGTASSSANAIITTNIPLELKKGTVCTFSIPEALTGQIYLHIHKKNADNYQNLLISAGQTSVTATLADDTDEYNIRFGVTNNTNYNIRTYMQLEIGSEPTSFEKYIPQKTVIIPLSNLELCEINTYKDKIYSDDGKFYLRKEIDKINSYNGETITTDYKSTTGGLNTGATVYYGINTTTTEIKSSNYPELYAALKEIQDYLTSYKINKEFILGYSSPEIEY